MRHKLYFAYAGIFFPFCIKIFFLSRIFCALTLRDSNEYEQSPFLLY